MTMTREPIRDTLRLVSHFAGRLRVRAETFRALPEVGAAVAEDLRAVDGVVDASASPVTGSLLVRYEPRRVELPRLVAFIVRAGGLHGLSLDVPERWEDKPSPGQAIRRVLGAADRSVRGATGGHADIRSAVPSALVGTGLAMFLAGRRRIPEWYDLVFWGFVAFCNLNPSETNAAHPPGPSNDVGGA
jgi:Heavy metal associated domain 2